jgi:GTP-binding protein
MLVDEVTIKVRAGDGGKGAVAFNKIRLSRGPTGGDGGRGGNVYFEGVQDIAVLFALANRQEFVAESGKDGRGQFLDGRAGADITVRVPVGTSFTNVESGYTQEITAVGERVLVAGGGVGGRGNFKFRSSTNMTPMEHEEGTQGDRATFDLKLRLIADVGLVGLPNAGKSSLLNELTRAKAKVAGYAFTTLEPNLGAYYELILADIPGLIEGASEGKGLGVKFLKHIERTKVLFHLVSAESDDVVRDYRVIRAELERYNSELAKKREYVFLSKSDAISAEEAREKLAALKQGGIEALPISIVDAESLARVRDILNELKDAGESSAG